MSFRSPGQRLNFAPWATVVGQDENVQEEEAAKEEMVTQQRWVFLKIAAWYHPGLIPPPQKDLYPFSTTLQKVSSWYYPATKK